MRARVIAHKQPEGKAGQGGDILLHDGQTVEGVIREYLVTALENTDHEVVEDSAADASVRRIDVHIKQFWAWAETGASSVKYKAKIVAALTVTGRRTPITISAEAEVPRAQPATDAWTAVLVKALDEFRVAVEDYACPCSDWFGRIPGTQ